jgi:hypothetical protein
MPPADLLRNQDHDSVVLKSLVVHGGLHARSAWCSGRKTGYEVTPPNYLSKANCFE